jgi:hypothetical protein
LAYTNLLIIFHTVLSCSHRTKPQKREQQQHSMPQSYPSRQRALLLPLLFAGTVNAFTPSPAAAASFIGQQDRIIMAHSTEASSLSASSSSVTRLYSGLSRADDYNQR